MGRMARFSVGSPGFRTRSPIGVLFEGLPDHAGLQARAEEFARTIASHALLTLRITKEAMRRLCLAVR